MSAENEISRRKFLQLGGGALLTYLGGKTLYETYKERSNGYKAAEDEVTHMYESSNGKLNKPTEDEVFKATLNVNRYNRDLYALDKVTDGQYVEGRNTLNAEEAFQGLVDWKFDFRVRRGEIPSKKGYVIGAVESGLGGWLLSKLFRNSSNGQPTSENEIFSQTSPQNTQHYK